MRPARHEPPPVGDGRLCRWAAVWFAVLALAAHLPARAQVPCDLSSFQVEFRRLVDAVEPGVVKVIAYSQMQQAGDTDLPEPVKESVGSGVVIDRQGHVLTARSVVGQSRLIFVRTDAGEQHDAVFLGEDAGTGLALLMVGGATLRPARMGKPQGLEPGAWLITVGQGASEYPNSSLGVFLERPSAGLLQTSARAFPGQTGGAVINVAGEVVGLLLGEMEANPPQPVGAAFSAAVPIDVAERVAGEIAEVGGPRARGFLGVQVQAAKQGLKVLLDFDKGVLIGSVLPNSPADPTIEAGDVIRTFDGVPVETPEQFAELVASKEPGDACVVELLRGDIELTRRVVLGAAPRRQLAPADSTNDARLNVLRQRIDALRQELERLESQIDR